MISTFIQSTIIFLVLTHFGCTLLLTAGFCLLSSDLAADLEQYLNEINDIWNSRAEKSVEIRRLKKKINGIIQFHAEAKELSDQY